jgi:NAD+ synthase
MNLSDKIVEWIKNYAKENGRKTLVVGISGGIDSAVVSTLCAKTGLPVYAISMPIEQLSEQHDLSMDHGHWLTDNFINVEHLVMDLDKVYDKFYLEMLHTDMVDELALANTKSRLRMVALHQVSGSKRGIVVGTGNKVEDFGVGFYTKYGDGGVDISPIADLMKSEVWELGKELGVLQEIIDAPPTDGLWEDGRTDKDQLGGLTYQQLEKAMELDKLDAIPVGEDAKLLEQYHKIRKPNLHKMNPIPIYKKEV